MKYFFIVLLAAATLGCAPKVDYRAEIASKEWRLVEIKQGENGVKIDRAKLADEGFANAFIVVFENDRLAGAGTANRFFASYAIETDAINISTVASTRAAPIKEPKALKEREFFSLLRNAAQWRLNAGKLELSTKNAGGGAATLVFEGV
ncbi:MAG: META domain-containing protein [Helicobacteraceae bacterium]|jgi:heat shock protein HslJ|nr:META domain-containing protein [Helicobacteraceae bacterium]